MIGQTIWIQDSNRRLYQDDEGNKSSTPNLRYSFASYIITGETKQSWLVESHGHILIKINKKTLHVSGRNVGPGTHPYAFMSVQDVEDYIWMQENEHLIVRRLQSCRDVAILRQIDAILRETQ